MQGLPERMLPDQGAQFGGEPVEAVEVEEGLEAAFQRLHPLLLEEHHGGVVGEGGYVGERCAAPQCQSGTGVLLRGLPVLPVAGLL